jgi:hypothetical protein
VSNSVRMIVNNFNNQAGIGSETGSEA